MLTTLLVLGGACLYLQIGRLLSNKAWEAWQKKKRSLGSFLFFPWNFALDEIGYSDRVYLISIADFSSKRAYLLGSSLVWPWRFVWPFIALPLMGVFSSLAIAGALVSDNKFIRSCFGRIGRALLALGVPVYKLGKALFLALNEPEEAIKGLGRGIKSAIKWLGGGKVAVLPEATSEDALPAMQEELYGLLAEKEVLEQKVQELQIQICAEEAKRMGTYREPPKLAADNQDNSNTADIGLFDRE